jgi:hypothetical protein
MSKLVTTLTALCLGTVTLVQATTLEQLSLDEMIQKSTGIVHAKVVSSYAALRGSDVYTFYRLEVSESWKGPKSTEVAVPGGVMKGVRQIIAGVPYLKPGEDYLLFLWTGKSGLTQVIGMSQGVFAVKVDASGNPIVTRAAAADSIVDRSGRPVDSPSLTLKLSEMQSRVARSVREEVQ